MCILPTFRLDLWNYTRYVVVTFLLLTLYLWRFLECGVKEGILWPDLHNMFWTKYLTLRALVIWSINRGKICIVWGYIWTFPEQYIVSRGQVCVGTTQKMREIILLWAGERRVFNWNLCTFFFFLVFASMCLTYLYLIYQSDFWWVQVEKNLNPIIAD